MVQMRQPNQQIIPISVTRVIMVNNNNTRNNNQTSTSRHKINTINTKMRISNKTTNNSLNLIKVKRLPIATIVSMATTKCKKLKTSYIPV